MKNSDENIAISASVSVCYSLGFWALDTNLARVTWGIIPVSLLALYLVIRDFQFRKKKKAPPVLQSRPCTYQGLINELERLETKVKQDQRDFRIILFLIIILAIVMVLSYVVLKNSRIPIKQQPPIGFNIEHMPPGKYTIEILSQRNDKPPIPPDSVLPKKSVRWIWNWITPSK